MTLPALGLGSLMNTWETEVWVSEGPRGVDSVWFGIGGSDWDWVDSGWQDGLDSWL